MLNLPPWLREFADVQRHSFYLKSSVSQRLSFITLAGALLATFTLWPDVNLQFYPFIKYLLSAVTLLLLVRQYLKVRQWQFRFTLDEYGRVLASDEQVWQLGERSWVSPWLIVCFLERNGRDTPLFCFADMLADDDYRSLCRLIINQRSLPQSG